VTVFGLDISNYTGFLGSVEIITMQQKGVRYVVPRVSLEAGRQRHEITRQHFDILAEFGIETGGYLWCYGSWSPEATVQDSLALLDGRPCRWLWLDVEDEGDPVSADWILRAVRECERHGRAVGVYTGRWYWQPRYGDWNPGVALWTAEYDQNPAINRWTPYSGWTYLTGKQYAGSGQQTVFPFSCDLNTFDDAVLAPVKPPPIPEPEPDGVTLDGVKLGLISKVLDEDWPALHRDAGKLVGVQ
jgi:GH25 family lysozyme M1 (1,4-beta-N-acetylmuramidase)